jgi:hypothetical protein
MKKQFLFILLLVLATNMFSQPSTTTTPAFKIDYLKQSKFRKTVATIFLAGGATSLLIGSLISKGELIETSAGGFWGTGELYYKNGGTKDDFIIVGFLSALTSIPIYLASHHSKKKALRLSFKNETAPQIQKSSFVNKSLPSLTFNMSL